MARFIRSSVTASASARFRWIAMLRLWHSPRQRADHHSAPATDRPSVTARASHSLVGSRRRLRSTSEPSGWRNVRRLYGTV